MSIIDDAISFYEQSPDGQYDELAVLSLQYVKAILSGCMQTCEIVNRLEEIKRISGDKPDRLVPFKFSGGA